MAYNQGNMVPEKNEPTSPLPLDSDSEETISCTDSDETETTDVVETPRPEVVKVKSKKKVMFPDDEHLVFIREIPRKEDDLTDDSDPCDPEKLAAVVARVENMALKPLQSEGSTCSLSETLSGKGRATLNVSVKDLHYKAPPKVGSESVNENGVTEKKRTRKLKKSSNKESTVTENGIVEKKRTRKQPRKTSKDLGNRRSSVSDNKVYDDSRNKASAQSRTKDPVKQVRTNSPSQRKSSLPKSKLNLSLKRDKPNFYEYQRPISAVTQLTRQSDTDLPWLNMPRVHRSPYRQSSGKQSPPTTPIIQPLFTNLLSFDPRLSPRRADVLGSPLARPATTDGSLNGASKSRHLAWQIANGNGPIETPFISPMWELPSPKPNYNTTSFLKTL